MKKSWQQAMPGVRHTVNIYEAIFRRISVRKYRTEPIEEEKLEHLRRFIQLVRGLHEEIPFRIEIRRRADGLRGLGLVEAPYYLIFYSGQADGYLENAGYVLEQIVLYLTSRGIGTCYQGGLRFPQNSEMTALGLTPVIAVAFGIPAKKPLVEEREARWKKTQRETVICKEEIGDDVREILRAVSAAPSAMNRCPWRLVVYHNRLHLFARKSASVWNRIQRIDMGIVLYHIAAAAEEQWLEIRILRMDSITEQKTRGYKYTATVLLKSVL